MQAEKVGPTVVYMQERVIEGTVFQGHTIEVEGDFNRKRTQFNAEKITDLVTGATTGYTRRTLKYPEGRSLSMTGVIDNLQPLEQPHPGQRQQAQHHRFVLLRTDTNERISVERVGQNIGGGLIEQGDEVVVDGEWTDRNVLRANKVTRTRR
jgi:hypothetical protein